MQPVTKETEKRMVSKRLNYLLVMPRLVQNVGDGYSFPLGIAYISSSLKKAGRHVVTINLNHREGNPKDIIRREIENHRIDVVATGGLSFQYSTIKRVIQAAKQADKRVVTIVGGGIITGDPEPAMEALADADYGVIGEGEITINELADALENRLDPSGVDGIIFKGASGYVSTPSRKEVVDIDSIPWPDYEGFDIEPYLAANSPGISGLNGRNTVFMLASRSCPYNCTFCFHTVGRKYRQRSLDGFFQELDHLVSTHHIEFVCMADELFARDIQRVTEFCNRIKTYNVQWWAQFRVDDITPDLLNILKDGGCQVMSFGLESADNRILKSMRKGTTVEQIERTLKLVYDAGISLEGAFIFGDIEETNETATNTLKWWREHSEYRINLNLITVFPGSYLYQYACEKGIITDRVAYLKAGCPQINVSKLTDSELAELIRQIMEAPVSLTKPLQSPELTGIDHQNGRINLSGVCTLCGQYNAWENIKLFSMNFIPCKKCGQRYNVPLFGQLKHTIESNINGLLAAGSKVAVWGINHHTANLLENSTLCKEENIFPIDISESKRKIRLYGKQIFPPGILNTESIDTVVVAIPVYFTQIESQIQADHDSVRHIIDICSLTDPGYRKETIAK